MKTEYKMKTYRGRLKVHMLDAFAASQSASTGRGGNATVKGNSEVYIDIVVIWSHFRTATSIGLSAARRPDLSEQQNSAPFFGLGK